MSLRRPALPSEVPAPPDGRPATEWQSLAARHPAEDVGSEALRTVQDAAAHLAARVRCAARGSPRVTECEDPRRPQPAEAGGQAHLRGNAHYGERWCARGLLPQWVAGSTPWADKSSTVGTHPVSPRVQAQLATCSQAMAHGQHPQAGKPPCDPHTREHRAPQGADTPRRWVALSPNPTTARLPQVPAPCPRG